MKIRKQYGIIFLFLCFTESNASSRAGMGGKPTEVPIVRSEKIFDVPMLKRPLASGLAAATALQDTEGYGGSSPRLQEIGNLYGAPAASVGPASVKPGTARTDWNPNIYLTGDEGWDGYEVPGALERRMSGLSMNSGDTPPPVPARPSMHGVRAGTLTNGVRAGTLTRGPLPPLPTDQDNVNILIDAPTRIFAELFATDKMNPSTSFQLNIDRIKKLVDAVSYELKIVEPFMRGSAVTTSEMSKLVGLLNARLRAFHAALPVSSDEVLAPMVEDIERAALSLFKSSSALVKKAYESSPDYRPGSDERRKKDLVIRLYDAFIDQTNPDRRGSIVSEHQREQGVDLLKSPHLNAEERMRVAVRLQMLPDLVQRSGMLQKQRKEQRDREDWTPQQQKEALLKQQEKMDAAARRRTLVREDWKPLAGDDWQPNRVYDGVE